MANKPISTSLQPSTSGNLMSFLFLNKCLLSYIMKLLVLCFMFFSSSLNDRKGCIFTNDMKLTRQNMKYFVFILSAMKYKSK